MPTPREVPRAGTVPWPLRPLIALSLSLRAQLALCILLLLQMAPARFAFSADAPMQPAAAPDARLDWWREARFGMFIHWGLYAVPAGSWHSTPTSGAGEWIMNDQHIPVAEYEKLSEKFDPVQFDADAWAQAAADAGMKYLVITSKHHDGFCMFDTAQTDYNVVKATPWHKDPLEALSKACPRHGVRFCIYYSIMDWHSPDQVPAKPDDNHPDYNPTHFAPAKKDAYVAYMKSQLRELITRYHPGVIWFDGQWTGGWTDQDGRELYRYLRELDPKVIVNDRVKGTGDFGTPEQTIPPTGLPGRNWETCMTINNTWGYKDNDTGFKSATTLTRNLIDIASKGGNYLLNVGPTAQGTIPRPEIERLAAMGKWLKANGKAIYGTTASPFRKLPFDGRCTRRGNTLFLHVFTWPSGGARVEGVETKPRSARFLNGGKAAQTHWSKTSDGVPVLTIGPPTDPDPVATVVELNFDSPPEVRDVAAVVRPSADGTLLCRAADADVHGTSARYESGDGKDNIGYWTDASDFVTWQISIPAPGRYTVSVTYACQNGAAGSQYMIEAAGSKLSGKVAPTGGWNEFTTTPLGTIHLPAGKLTLTVRPTAMPGYAVMNLRQVVLTPVAQVR